MHSELINYAADFNGAEILSAEPVSKTLLEAVLNPTENIPQKVLSPDNYKGNCWGFEGSRGSIGVKLKKPIYPLHFSIKHANIVPFDSAPKHFCVYRVSEDKELLGCYDFFISKGSPNPEFTQIFECLQNCNKPSQSVLFQFYTNHGASHTCIYQLLVHGDPISLSY